MKNKKYKLHPFNQGEISIYIHWPFCIKKCPYCDFNSYVSNNIDYKNWRSGYFKSIENQKKLFENKKINTIFFGGGTPSLMPPNMVGEIIQYFRNHNIKNDVGEINEITLESNPSTFEIDRFKDFKDAGITRLSTGIQSFNEKNLKFLGRNHTSQEGIRALEEIAKIFDKSSFDLIFGLPDQTLTNWKEDMQIAMSFLRDHISIYQLTIEPNTPFYKYGIKEASDTIGEQLYNYTKQELENRGLNQYEISNYAKKGFESLHNLNYWKGGEYIGIGPNAQGRVFFENKWFSTKEYKNYQVWLNKSREESNINDTNPMFDEFLKVNDYDRFTELVLTSLRVNTHLDKRIIPLLDTDKVKNLLENGLLESKNNYLFVTDKGRLCLNYVTQFLLI